MKGLFIKTFLFLFLLINTKTLVAEEIKYNFTKGATYSYKYTVQTNSQANAPIISSKKSTDSKSIDFDIKVVGFQDNAYILDIGNQNATYRRYISPNGILKGAPAEDKTNLPFFISFPEGDWRIGKSIKQNTEVLAFGKKYPVIWSLTLNSIDNIRNLAEITFETKFNISDNKYFSRTMALSGEITFNMAEGVIHKAEWKSSYSAKQICKEVTITRNLWSFEKQANHILMMTGVDK